MVGLFSRLSRSRSLQPFSVKEKQASGLLKEPSSTFSSNRVDPLDEFVPVEHPVEPKHNDKPVKCPPPEPCIVHDGRIWKERFTTNARRLHENSFVRGKSVPTLRTQAMSLEILRVPSFSAPAKALIESPE